MGASKTTRGRSRRDKTSKSRTVWGELSGNCLIGTTVNVSWPSDSSYYKALVVDFETRTNQHKLLYFADESIEVLQLGDGPSQRAWIHASNSDQDALIGSKIVLYDHGEASGDEWFDFMRANEQSQNDKLQVIVLQRIIDVMPDDVVGPMSTSKEACYRVLNVANDFLALIDLSAIDYDVVSSPKADSLRPTGLSYDALEPTTAVDKEEHHSDADPSKQSPHMYDSDAEIMPTAAVDDAEDSLIPPSNKSALQDAEPADDALDIDIDKVAKVVSADRIVRAEGGFGSKSAFDADDGLEPPIRYEAGGSQETHDEPIQESGYKSKKKYTSPRPACDYPNIFEDENGPDTASDEEKVGWVSTSKSKKVTCQVGDFINLDTGIGGALRTAYVEAYLPETNTHFVAFCDARAGNLQIKLTSENHTVVGEEEGKRLARRKYDSEDDSEVGQVASDESNEKKTRRSYKRRGRQPTPKAKKRAIRMPEVKGRSAGAEICGRCISIVWPGKNLVYVALVLGYSSFSKQHQIVYMVDHCIETLDLKYREWTLLAREKEPWIENGMVGKRLYVFWVGEYDDEESQRLAEEVFPNETKVAYEAYVLSYIGDGRYKIIYPATEDTEIRELKIDGVQNVSAVEKEWDLLDARSNEVGGLPIIGWTD